MAALDPEVGTTTRKMLGHAIRGETEDLSVLILSVGNELYPQVLAFCLLTAAYIAVDVCDRWPTDADLHAIARIVEERGTEVKLKQADVYDYLSGSAIGFKPLTEVLGSEAAAFSLPLFVTGSMVFMYRPKGMEWWDYFDMIWSAYDRAETTNVFVLPALQVTAKMLKAKGLWKREDLGKQTPEE